MKAGSLKRRIVIERRESGQSANGEPLQVWVEHDRVWANIRNLNGREFAAAGAELSKITTSIRIRRRRDLTAAMRIVHGADIYNIEAVLPDEDKHEFVDLACSTGANAG